MSHTPGPWELLDGRNIKTVNGIFYLAYGCDEHSKKPFFFSKEKGWSELDANAKLIAAAPELIEAIIDLFNQLDNAGLHGFVLENHGISFEKLNQVLEKATGGIV